jgi:hypothetical protein
MEKVQRICRKVGGVQGGGDRAGGRVAFSYQHSEVIPGAQHTPHNLLSRLPVDHLILTIAPFSRRKVSEETDHIASKQEGGNWMWSWHS